MHRIAYSKVVISSDASEPSEGKQTKSVSVRDNILGAGSRKGGSTFRREHTRTLTIRNPTIITLQCCTARDESSHLSSQKQHFIIKPMFDNARGSAHHQEVEESKTRTITSLQHNTQEDRKSHCTFLAAQNQFLEAKTCESSRSRHP